MQRKLLVSRLKWVLPIAYCLNVNGYLNVNLLGIKHDDQFSKGWIVFISDIVAYFFGKLF